jgi:hypothetical protein
MANENPNVVQRSYAHATKLYLSTVGDKYAHIPKLGFMYCVHFNINSSVIDTSSAWAHKYLALLVSEVQLPKFKITTETVNQYNRKTNVQTKLSYEPISFTFHDDVSNDTTGFWVNYYKYFYQDSRYSLSKLRAGFSDTKYSSIDNPYGLNPSGDRSRPYFLDSIDIFLLNSGVYTKVTIINPVITSWEHDSVSQKESTKTMTNKMSVVYEDVIYSQGSIQSPSQGDEYVTLFQDPAVYDDSPDPLTGTQIPPDQEVFNAMTFSNDLDPAFNEKIYLAIKNKPTNVGPNPSKQLKNSLSIGQIINDINTIKAFKQNPRQMLNVYGLNIKNLITSKAIGLINADPANVAGKQLYENQGNLSTSTYNAANASVNNDPQS